MEEETTTPEGLGRCSTRRTRSPMARWPPALSTRSIGATTTTALKGPAIPTGSRSSTSADRQSRSATTVAETRAFFPSVRPTDWLPPTGGRRSWTGTPSSLHGWPEDTSLFPECPSEPLHAASMTERDGRGGEALVQRHDGGTSLHRQAGLGLGPGPGPGEVDGRSRHVRERSRVARELPLLVGG